VFSLTQTHSQLKVKVNSRNAPTAASNFLSHMSLIVQPAPRMMKAPTAKRDMYHIGVEIGRWFTVDAMVIDQAEFGCVSAT
jgi:hypothetical protein